jgi:hypothetical protein
MLIEKDAQQPRFLEGADLACSLEAVGQSQRLGQAHVEHERTDEVLPERLQGFHPRVAIDECVGLILPMDDNGRPLPFRGQRARQSTPTNRIGDAETPEAQSQVGDLDRLHALGGLRDFG